MSTVINLIKKHRDVLSLSTDADCLNSDVNEVISYFEHNPLKYCVLVADADKIMAMIKQEKGVNLRLLETADRKVGKFFSSGPSGPNIHGCGEQLIGSKQ